MTRLRDVCEYIRSKNAGPFWITIDLFFKDREAYRAYGAAAALGAEAIARLYGVKPEMVKRFALDTLMIVKLSYPRAAPQGGVVERDMHGGQQFVRLLDVELDAPGEAVPA